MGAANALEQESESRPCLLHSEGLRSPKAQTHLLPEGVQGVLREATFELDLEGQNKLFGKNRTWGKLTPGGGNVSKG